MIEKGWERDLDKKKEYKCDTFKQFYSKRKSKKKKKKRQRDNCFAPLKYPISIEEINFGVENKFLNLFFLFFLK